MKNSKFELRAWDKTRDEMFCYENMSGIKELHFTQDMSVDSIKLFEYMPNGSFAFKDLNINDVELMQYTGLKDKNGVKIFEGDIVRVVRHNYLDETCIISFERGCLLFEGIGFITTFSYTLLNIIGNKFENPELLNTEID